jgi:hypothetical protein
MASSNFYYLYILIHSDTHVKDIFLVKIPKSADVATLKEVIVAKMQWLKHIELNKIDLYQVSIPVHNGENFRENLKKAEKHLLLPTNCLENLFPKDPKLETLHIIVEVGKSFSALFL